MLGCQSDRTTPPNRVELLFKLYENIIRTYATAVIIVAISWEIWIYKPYIVVLRKFCFILGLFLVIITELSLCILFNLVELKLSNFSNGFFLFTCYDIKQMSNQDLQKGTNCSVNI